jgi:hypothetical protein
MPDTPHIFHPDDPEDFPDNLLPLLERAADLAEGRQAAPSRGMSVTLDEADRAKLAEANRLLTELTEGHSSACGCELCEARWRTDVQDEPGCWTVPGVTPAEQG